MNDIQGILFDADGTLIDTYDVILTPMRYAANEALDRSWQAEGGQKGPVGNVHRAIIRCNERGLR